MRHGVACAADGHPAEAAREFKKALARRGGVRFKRSAFKGPLAPLISLDFSLLAPRLSSWRSL
jgi:hypothetical protein